MKIYSLLCAFLLLAASSLAASSFPAPSGYVNDFAGLLSSEQRQALEQKLAQFEQSTSNEISIATLTTLEGDSIDHVAEQLFQAWAIGKRTHDNGVLIVVAPAERKMRIEVGYGLEGALTDAQSSWIIRNVMQPAFKAGDFYSGLDGATSQIIAATQGEYVPSETRSTRKSGRQVENIIFGIFAVLYFLGVILGRSKSYWAGGLLGAVVGGAAGWFFFSTAMALLLAGGVGLLGLVFDFIVSRMPKNNIHGGPRPPFWFGGFGGGSGGSSGFGGFGGGRSGGGGSSGGW